MLVVKNSPADAADVRDVSSIPGLGSSPGEEHCNPFQDSYLENPIDRGVWQAMVSRAAKSWTQLKRLNTAHELLNNREWFYFIIYFCQIFLSKYFPSLH